MISNGYYTRIFFTATLALLLASCSPYDSSIYTGGIDESLFAAVLIISGVITIALALAAPIELLIFASVILSVLGITNLIDLSVLFYLRFVPTGLLAVRTLMHIVSGRGKTYYLPRLLLRPFGLLCLFALASTVYSTSPSVTLQRTVSMGLILISFGIAVPVYLGGQPQRIVRLLFWTSLSVMGLLIASIVLFITNPEQAIIGTNRIAGIFSNANGLGMVAMLCFFLAFGIASLTSSLPRAVMLFAMVSSVASVLLSGSRASLAGLGIGIVVLILINMWVSRHRNLRERVALVLVISVFIVVAMHPEIFDVITRSGDSGRLEIWTNLLDYGSQSPILGYGFNASDEAYIEYLATQSVSLTLGGHSSYLQLFIGLGLLGLIILFWGFCTILLNGMSVIRSGISVPFFHSLYAALIACLVNAIFESHLLSFGNGVTVLLWLIIALLCIYIQYPHLLPTSIHQPIKEELLLTTN